MDFKDNWALFLRPVSKKQKQTKKESWAPSS
jgi:hypothetical protein